MTRRTLFAAALGLVFLASGTLIRCEETSRPDTAAKPQQSPESAVPASGAPKTRVAAARRIVAIGDLHGDLEAARLALQVAGATDSKDRWSGKDLVVVQLGDQIDRGDDDRAILDLFDRLAKEAHAAGGAVYSLVGNHEAMNVALDFRYVTPGALKKFDEFEAARQSRARRRRAPGRTGRVAAFRPGGPYAKLLSRRSVVMMIGDNVFVHGGITPEAAQYGLEKLNLEARSWMLGEKRRMPRWIYDQEGPLWTRSYSKKVDADDCRSLRRALRILGARRMVVGHTVQEHGVSSACGDMVWRVDVGMSEFYGGPVQILEIQGSKVKVLKLE